MGKDSFIPFLNFLQEHVASGLCPGVAVPPSATSLVSSDHVQGGGARSVRDREEAWRGEASGRRGGVGSRRGEVAALGLATMPGRAGAAWRTAEVA